MSQTLERPSIDRLLEMVAGCLPPEAAAALVEVRIDAALQARLDELADRCTAGELTPDERHEYADYVRTIDVLAILQLKARRVLQVPTAG
jgi:hypothetical protein